MATAGKPDYPQKLKVPEGNEKKVTLDSAVSKPIFASTARRSFIRFKPILHLLNVFNEANKTIYLVPKFLRKRRFHQEDRYVNMPTCANGALTQTITVSEWVTLFGHN